MEQFYYFIWTVVGAVVLYYLLNGFSIEEHEIDEPYTWNGQTKSVNEFCEENDLCPICIDGGWECGSDHK